MPRRLLLLTGLAIFATVLFHAEGWAFVAMFSWAHRYLPPTVTAAQQAQTAAYYGLRLIEQFVAFGIPTFLFVSGFFLAFSTGRGRPTVAWSVIRTRIKFLIIPYLLWTGLLWIVLWLDGKRPTALGYAGWLLTGGTNPAYYYVPLLVQLYLLSPIVVRLAKTHWKALLLVTGLVQLGVYLAQYPSILQADWGGWQSIFLMPKWLFPTRLFWFSFGVVFGFHLPAFKRVFERTKWLALGSVAVLFVVGVLEWELLGRLSSVAGLPMRETVVDMLYAGAFIWSFLAFSDVRVPFAEGWSMLGGKSFGIYLVHSPVMEYVMRGLYHLAPGSLAYPGLLIPLLIIIGLAVPLGLMHFVRNSPARPLYSYQFG